MLLNVDVASGDRVLADRLKAEALVLRAWCHYLLVNFYAKAYNPATAETDPGIVYALETDDMAAPNEKLTVAKVYEMILADLNAALDLGSLPVVPNKMRVGLSFAYAVKAKVLMSIRDYDGAFAAVSYTHLDVYKRQVCLCLNVTVCKTSCRSFPAGTGSRLSWRAKRYRTVQLRHFLREVSRSMKL